MTKEDMEQIVEGVEATAAKVRALHAAGAGIGEIRRFLNISYQHAYSVLLRAGAIQKKSERGDSAAEDDGEIIVAHADASGAVVFDKSIMEEFGIRPGEQVFCRRTADGLTLIGREAALEQITQLAKARMPGQASLIEALLKPKTTN